MVRLRPPKSPDGLISRTIVIRKWALPNQGCSTGFSVACCAASAADRVIVMTKSGEQYSGLVRKDAPDEVVLATGPNAEARIARSDISELRPGTISVMPAGLDEQLNRQELADLLAFLKATKWGPR